MENTELLGLPAGSFSWLLMHTAGKCMANCAQRFPPSVSGGLTPRQLVCISGVWSAVSTLGQN